MAPQVAASTGSLSAHPCSTRTCGVGVECARQPRPVVCCAITSPACARNLAVQQPRAYTSPAHPSGRTRAVPPRQSLATAKHAELVSGRRACCRNGPAQMDSRLPGGMPAQSFSKMSMCAPLTCARAERARCSRPPPRRSRGDALGHELTRFSARGGFSRPPAASARLPVAIRETAELLHGGVCM